MAKQPAAPYEEGSGWSMRRRIRGEQFYVSGLGSAAAARKAMQAEVNHFEQRGAPKGLGPQRTSVAQALQDYGLQRLKFMKGAPQEANRINKFLRAVGLPTLQVTAWDAAVAAGKVAAPQRPKGQGAGELFFVELAPASPTRQVPQGLGGHRGQLAEASKTSDAQRAHLARMTVADVRRHHVQDLMDALRSDGRAAATVQLERALLRTLFNHAHAVWNWSEPGENPATSLTMPRVDNERERVMSADEQRRFDEAIEENRNKLVGPTVTLLRETAMRTSEPLARARWCDVDWQRRVLKLTDAKSGSRNVPLSPLAIQALEELRALTGGAPDEPLVQMTYESLKASWQRVCKRAGIKDLNLHDLRHTAATRLALKSGNVFLVKALTGHKTLKMVERYVNVRADDVVAFMHPAEQEKTPSGMPEAVVASDAPAEPPVQPSETSNVVHAQFGRRRSA
jgi:integrase